MSTTQTVTDTRVITNPEGLYNPVPDAYSFAVSAAGQPVFLAGHWASDLEGNVIEGDYAAQVAQTFRNLAVTLAAEGLGFENIVKVTAFVVGHTTETTDILIAAEKEIWGDRPPAHSLIPVPALALSGMRIEVEAVAMRPTA